MRRPHKRALMAATLAAAVALGVPTVAAADPGDGGTGTPSSSDVTKAKAMQAETAAKVKDIEQQILQLANLQDQTTAKAGEAAEAYNAAQEQLAAAKTSADAATKKATAATKAYNAAEGELNSYLLEVQQYNPQFSVLEPLLTGEGLRASLDNAEAVTVVGDLTQQLYAKASAAKNEHDQAQARAAAAVKAQQQAVTDLAAAKEQAADSAQRVVTSQQQAEQQRTQLIDQLAKARNTTVALERQRVAALEAQRQREADAAAQRAAERQRQADAAAQRAREQAANDASRDPGTDSRTPARPDSTPTPAPKPKPKPDPTPSDSGTGSGVSASTARAALSWARAQIGKPYQWGGNGPGSFDCSGLTSQAYLKATGIWIGRTAQEQYSKGIKISPSNARPGDLIFWSSNGSLGGIYHVAMIAGNGMMVEAPRPGRSIGEVPVRWSGTMPYLVRIAR